MKEALGGNNPKGLNACLQGQGPAMSASEAAELRAAAAEKAALLGAAEERLARLEALHRVAQVPHCPLHAGCASQLRTDILRGKETTAGD